MTTINLSFSFSKNRVLIAVSDTGTIAPSTAWTYSNVQHNLESGGRVSIP